jgi:hypothetical protein
MATISILERSNLKNIEMKEKIKETLLEKMRNETLGIILLKRTLSEYKLSEPFCESYPFFVYTIGEDCKMEESVKR